MTLQQAPPPPQPAVFIIPAAEPRAPGRSGLDLQLRAHRRDELAGDGEPEPRPREGEPHPAPAAAERLIQPVQRLGIDPSSRIAHRELDADVILGDRRDLHEAMLGKLQSVAGEVEQRPGERHRVADAHVAGGRPQVHGEAFLLGHRAHHVLHRLERLGDRERARLVVHQPLPTARQLDRVAHEAAQAERRAVDQRQLAALDLVDVAALPVLQGL